MARHHIPLNAPALPGLRCATIFPVRLVPSAIQNIRCAACKCRTMSPPVVPMPTTCLPIILAWWRRAESYAVLLRLDHALLYYCTNVLLAVQLAKSIGSALGGGLAGITQSLDEMGAELDAEEAAAGETGEKKGLFEDRTAKMQAAMEK